MDAGELVNPDKNADNNNYVLAWSHICLQCIYFLHEETVFSAKKNVIALRFFHPFLTWFGLLQTVEM